MKLILEDRRPEERAQSGKTGQNRTCSHCGERVNPYEKYCRFCGFCCDMLYDASDPCPPVQCIYGPPPVWRKRK
ncbi:MAG: hypothetical protein IJY28_00335 [Clostridia bacterium]|nr:hypothetical protein [Clostridia bacterium]